MEHYSIFFCCFLHSFIVQTIGIMYGRLFNPGDIMLLESASINFGQYNKYSKMCNIVHDSAKFQEHYFYYFVVILTKYFSKSNLCKNFCSLSCIMLEYK